MKLSKRHNIHCIERPKPKAKDRFAFITDEHVRLVIPVGPRFQVDIPSIGDYSDSDNNSKWAGTPIWPNKGRNNQEQCLSNNNNTVGRSDEICECTFPGSVECVRRHVSNKKFQLQIDLGPAFWKWKFDDMGEDVSKLWNSEEQMEFERVVKSTNATSQGKSFLTCALECFPCQTKESIVSYYLNVYIPRRISAQTRSSCAMVNTDDDEELPSPKGSCKRLQANGFTSKSSIST